MDIPMSAETADRILREVGALSPTQLAITAVIVALIVVGLSVHVVGQSINKR